MLKTIYFFDLGIFNPYKMSNSKINVNQVTKEKRIFFKEDFFNEENPKKWEVRYDNSYPTVFYDKEISKYRCYYHTFTIDKGSSEVSLEERKNSNYNPNTPRVVSLCYAQSDDGVNWERPNLGITEFEGNKDNNIIGHYLHGSSILYDEKEKDPQKKYKMFTKIDYGNGIHFIAVSFSKDGIHFEKFIKINDFNPRADTHNHIIYDETINKYVLITRTWRDSMRIACISFSEDFINWSPIQEIMPPRGYENQVYSMPIMKKDDYIIGFASMFHEGDMSQENFDTVDVELAYSYNYKGFNYVDTENKFIERGEGKYPHGEFDCGCIYTSPPVEIDNKLYFYYMGGNGQHTNFRETSLSRAYIEKDRLAYMTTKDKDKEGIIYTNGFTFLTNEIYLDADVMKDGYINIELYKNNHEKIQDNQVVLKQSGEKYKLIFSKNPDRSLTRLKITYKNAKIYSIQGDMDVYRIEMDNSLLRF